MAKTTDFFPFDSRLDAADSAQKPLTFYSSREERERLYPVRKAPDSRARRRAIRRLLLFDGGLVLLALVVAVPVMRQRPAVSWEHQLSAANEGDTCRVRLHLRAPGLKDQVSVRVTVAAESREDAFSARKAASGLWREWSFPRQPSGQVVRVHLHAGETELNLRTVIPQSTVVVEEE